MGLKQAAIRGTLCRTKKQPGPVFAKRAHGDLGPGRIEILDQNADLVAVLFNEATAHLEDHKRTLWREHHPDAGGQMGGGVLLDDAAGDDGESGQQNSGNQRRDDANSAPPSLASFSSIMASVS